MKSPTITYIYLTDDLFKWFCSDSEMKVVRQALKEIIPDSKVTIAIPFQICELYFDYDDDFGDFYYEHQNFFKNHAKNQTTYDPSDFDKICRMIIFRYLKEHRQDMSRTVNVLLVLNPSFWKD